MTLWDGLETTGQDAKSNRILIIGATNRPQDLDAAILRRMPARYHVPLPSPPQRSKIFELILKNEQLDLDVDLNVLATETMNFTGSDINEICRLAAMQRVAELCNQDVLNNNQQNTETTLRSINQNDFLIALQRVRETHKSHHSLNQLNLD